MIARVAPWQQSRTRHIYLAHFRVRFHELDPLGHVNNAVYLNYLEQTAIDHAAAEGFDAATLRRFGGVFIARRHEITYLRPAFENELLRVTTWPAEMSGARAIRAYEITRLDLAPGQLTPSDGIRDVTELPTADEVIVAARTEWAFVDTVSGRPRRIPVEVRDAFLFASEAYVQKT